MKYRYATGPVTIDGKKYNRGDILPFAAADVATLERHSRLGNEQVDKKQKKPKAQLLREAQKTAKVTSETKGPRNTNK